MSAARDAAIALAAGLAAFFAALWSGSWIRRALVRPITRARMWWRTARPTDPGAVRRLRVLAAPTEAEIERCASCRTVTGTLIADGRGVVHSDGVVERLLGLPPGGFLATAWIDLLHPDDHVETLRVIARPAGKIINRYLTSAGDYRLIGWRWSTVASGLRVVLATDGTLEHARARLSAIGARIAAEEAGRGR
ncbi:MAG: hypothetical protein AB7T06_39535 [Kofleriaceae bacterium]